MLVRKSWCLSRATGRLKANLRLSPPAFFLRWMKMAVAARVSIQLGTVVSGSVSSLLPPANLQHQQQLQCRNL